MTKITFFIASLTLLLLMGQTRAQTHFWRFDEDTGTVCYDSVSSPNSVNAQLNDATWLDLSKVGSGAAVTLNGADSSYVTFGSSVGQFGTKAFSVALWFQTTDNSLSLADLIGNRASLGNGNFLAIRLNNEGYVTAEVDQDSSGTNYIGIQSAQGGLNDGNWHHIVVTRSGTTLNLYIDGSLSNSGTGAGVANINSGNPFILGRSLVDASVSRFSPAATFDDVGIYNSALSASKVNSLYEKATNQ